MEKGPAFINHRKGRHCRKVGFTWAEKIVIDMRKKFKTHTQIMKEVPLTVLQVNGVIKRAFPSGDPFDSYIKRCILNGETGNEISRRLGLRPGSISRIAKRCGIDMWAEYKKRMPKKIIRKKIDWESFANDLYCYVLEGWSLERLGKDNGYKNGTRVSALLLQYVPEYAEASKDRRRVSKYKRKNRDTNNLTSEYKSEKEFQVRCVDILQGFHVFENVQGQSGMEVDLIILGDGGPDVLVELKICSRKVDEARAIGQSLVNSFTYTGGACVPLVCYPNDISLSKYFRSVGNVYGVYICRECELLGCLEGIRGLGEESFKMFHRKQKTGSVPDPPE